MYQKRSSRKVYGDLPRSIPLRRDGAVVCHKSQLELLKKLHDVQNVLRERRKQVQYAEALKNTCFLDGYLKNELSLLCISTLL